MSLGSLVPIGVVLICALFVVGAGWPAIPRKVRRAFVFGPALAWAAASVLGLSFAVVLPLRSQTATTLSVGLGFAGVGIWSLLQAIQAAREAKSDPLEPLFEPRPRFTPRPKQPLTEVESNRARDWLRAFQVAHLLERDEVTLSEVLGHSEHDDQYPYGLGNFLNALCSSKQQYRHLAFFFDGVEFGAEDAIKIVMEFARLAGREAGNVELEPIGAIREDRGQDYVITFDLDGQRQQMRFTMYSKALPWDLIEALQGRVRPDGDERTFEVAWSETLAMLAFLSSAQREELDGLSGSKWAAEVAVRPSRPYAGPVHMTTLVELVRKSEAYRFKSRELLERASDPQPKALRGLHLSQLLEFAAAALVLGDDALAHSYLQRFITEGLALASDKTTREAELEAAQAGYHEFAEPYFHLSLNGLRLELALGCRRRLEDRASLREMAERAAGAGCLGYESYLVELARGRREQAEATRAEYWAQWLEDELLWEDDLGWKISIALGQGRQQDFQELVAQFIHREEQKLAAHGPHGHHFSSTVLGLEGMAILGTAQACKMPFPTEMLSHFGLAELIAEGKFGCTSYPPRSVFRTRHSS